MARPSSPTTHNFGAHCLYDVPFPPQYTSHDSDNPKGVVAIHCNHGKGRTGTGIIALLLLIGYKKTAEECLQLYNSKRFSSQDYGVDQPCQLRYLEFIGNLVQKGRIDPKIPFYRLRKVCQSGLGPKYHLKITRVRDQQVLLDNVSFNNELDQS